MIPIASLTFAVIFAFANSASAQMIDLFDDQDSMPERVVAVGEASAESGQEASAPGAITLTFERQNTSILVLASVRGKEAYFLFDTGATYTTLTSAFARSIGAMPPPGAPVITVETANGPAATQMGLIDQFTLGRRPHSGVSYLLCDACPSGTYKGKPVVGLLGRNVIGRYRYSIDEGTGKIVMHPSSNYNDRIRDVENWLQIEDSRVGDMDRSGIRVIAMLRNHASKSVTDVEVVLNCGAREFSLGRKSIPSRSTRKFEGRVSGECPNPHFQYKSPRW